MTSETQRGLASDANDSKATRKSHLLEVVMGRGRVPVGELAELVGVSQVTVRKDLDELEARGLLKREHGVAVAGPADDMRTRLAIRYPAKRRIARAAAAIVADGETVMIESGSVCVLLAEELSATQRGITIVTNSAFIAHYLRRSPGANVILLGGTYQPESEALVGPMTAAAASSLFVDKLFIGIDGFTTEDGFTGKDIMRVETVRALATRAREVIVLSESNKFPSQGAVALLHTNEVARVFTDDALDSEIAQHLQRSGVIVVEVPVP